MPVISLDIGQQDEIDSRMDYLEGFINLAVSLSVFVTDAGQIRPDISFETEKMIEGLSALAFEADKKLNEIREIMAGESDDEAQNEGGNDHERK